MKRIKSKWSEEINVNIPIIRILHVTSFLKGVAYKESWIIRKIKHLCNIPVNKFKYLYKVGLFVQGTFLIRQQVVLFQGERFLIIANSGQHITIQSIDYIEKNLTERDFKGNKLIPSGCVLMIS